MSDKNYTVKSKKYRHLNEEKLADIIEQLMPVFTNIYVCT